jgi:hypothetical protein
VSAGATETKASSAVEREHALQFRNHNEEVHVWSAAVSLFLDHVMLSIRRKVAGSRPDEVIEFFSIYQVLLATLGPEVYLTSNRN